MLRNESTRERKLLKINSVAGSFQHVICWWPRTVGKDGFEPEDCWLGSGFPVRAAGRVEPAHKNARAFGFFLKLFTCLPAAIQIRYTNDSREGTQAHQ